MKQFWSYKQLLFIKVVSGIYLVFLDVILTLVQDLFRHNMSVKVDQLDKGKGGYVM